MTENLDTKTTEITQITTNQNNDNKIEPEKANEESDFSIKCSCLVDGSVQKEILKKQILISKILSIIGGIGSLLYIILGTIFENAPWAEYLLIFAGPLGIGIVLFVYYKKIIKKVQASPFTNEYEFKEKMLSVVSKNNSNEISSKGEIAYTNLLKLVETIDYLFIYVNQKSVFPILKSTLSEEDIKKIKDIFISLNKFYPAKRQK